MKKISKILGFTIIIALITVLGPENLWRYALLHLSFINKCYSPTINEDLIAMVKQEGFDYKPTDKAIIEDGLAKLNKQNILPDRNNIPKITHHVFFTFDKNSKPINQFYRAILTTYFNKINNASSNWQHFIWTNDINIFPEEIRNIPGVQLKNIKELKEHHLYPHISKAIDNANEVNSTAYFIEASDMTRLVALQKFGGIYSDMDYDLYNAENLLKLMNKFDFIGGRETFNEYSYYGNAFMAAKPNHPVINYGVYLMDRNHKLENLSDIPDYIKYPCSEIDRLYINSPPLLTIAYFAKNNIENNVDIVLPAFMVYYAGFARYKIGTSCNYEKITAENFYQQEDNLTSLLNDYLNNYPKEEIKTSNIYFNHEDKDRDKYENIGADMFCWLWARVNKKQQELKYYWK